MSRAFLISPGVDLVDEVLVHLVPEGADYSANIVVFPGKRPAHFLRKAISLQGRSFIPPRVFSLDRFIEFLNEPGPDRPPGQIDSIDAAAILFDLHEAVPDRIGGEQFRSLDAFLPLGIRIFDELEELVLSCRPDDEISKSVESVSLRGLHSIGTLYLRFYDEVRKLNKVTRALNFRSAVQDFRTEIFEPVSTIILAGFFPLSEAEKRLTRHLVSMKKAVVLFQEGPGIRDRLDELGIEAEEKISVHERPAISYHSATDSHGEIFGLAGLLRETVGRGKRLDHRSVIVVPDPSVIPALVHHALSVLPGSYNISIGYPHARTPVVGFLTSLMELVNSRYDGKFPASEYLRCLLHPYSKNLLFEGKAHVTRVLFHSIEELCLENTLPQFFSLEELESQQVLFEKSSAMAGERQATPERLAEHLRWIHSNLLTPLMDVSSAGDCAGRAIEILTFVAEQSTSRRHLFFSIYAESVIASLREITGSLIADRTFDHPAPVFRIVRDCLHAGKVALPGTPLDGLQVLGLLETRNLAFDHVFVLNTNDEMIPGESGRYSLVPNIVRQKLGLPTYRDRDRIAEYYFSLLLSGAREVSLLFTEDGAKTPSRFVEQLLWKSEKEKGSLERDTQISDVRYQVTLEHAKPGSITKPNGSGALLKGMTFSASSIDTYLTCGLKFYYRYVLRLEERDELKGDIDRAGLGQFVHAVLAEYYKPFVGKELDSTAIDPGRLARLVDNVFRESFGTEELGNQFLMKLQVKEHLSRFLLEYEAPRFRTGKVSLAAVEADMRAEKNGYRFRGKIDRVEQENDLVVIQDYKTTGDKGRLVIKPEKIVTGDRSTWAEGIGSFQLPLYLLLYVETTGCKPDQITPQYLLLGKNEFEAGIEVPLFGEGQPYKVLYPVLEGVLFAMMDEITDEQKPFEATQDLEANCPYCPFTQLCGTGWVKRRGYL